jgi:hypothetical protein
LLAIASTMLVQAAAQEDSSIEVQNVNIDEPLYAGLFSVEKSNKLKAHWRTENDEITKESAKENIKFPKNDKGFLVVSTSKDVLTDIVSNPPSVPRLRTKLNVAFKKIPAGCSAVRFEVSKSLVGTLSIRVTTSDCTPAGESKAYGTAAKHKAGELASSAGEYAGRAGRSVKEKAGQAGSYVADQAGAAGRWTARKGRAAGAWVAEKGRAVGRALPSVRRKKPTFSPEVELN